MDDSSERRIRERAYALWEKEGGPSGRDAEFWERARQMIEAEAAAPPPPPKRRTRKESATDAALKETFPASDPPATSPGTAGGAASRKRKR